MTKKNSIFNTYIQNTKSNSRLHDRKAIILSYFLLHFLPTSKLKFSSINMRNFKRLHVRLFANGDFVSSSGGDVHHLHSAEAVDAVGADALEEDFGHNVRGIRKWVRFE